MEFKKIFTDKDSENLYKQMREAQEYISNELEKHISKELMLRVLEKNLLPILVYPDRSTEGAMPIWYSKEKHQINVHTPKPEIKLLTVDEWASFTGVGGPESFYEMIVKTMDKVKKLDG